jgi:hypothetical protein
MRRIGMTTRDELIAATAARYARADRLQRGRILDEFAAVTGFHRKHASRLLRSGHAAARSAPRRSRRLYDDAMREALALFWEASDRVCGKRLRAMLPMLVAAMERHGHIDLAPEVRDGVLAMSAATIDRMLRAVRSGGATGRVKRSPPSAAVRRAVPVRTFSDWGDPAPGFFEADLVAHSGPSGAGSFVQTLVITDIASGWTEFAPLLVREQRLLTEVLGVMQTQLTMPILGFDTDNDSVFMNARRFRRGVRRLALSGLVARRFRKARRRRRGIIYATRTKLACPSLRIRLSDLIAMATSVTRRASSRDFKVSRVYVPLRMFSRD